MTALCILLFAIGGLVRDGYPPLHSTHGARALGATFCLAGALLVLPWLKAVLVGLGVWAGFYEDALHAAGQGPDNTWISARHNLPRLLVSGLTSVLPVALIGWWLIQERWGFLEFAGLAKPVIWPVAWYILPKSGLTRYLILPPDYQESFFAPTRIAAMTFGAVIGAGVSFLH